MTDIEILRMKSDIRNILECIKIARGSVGAIESRLNLMVQNLNDAETRAEQIMKILETTR